MSFLGLEGCHALVTGARGGIGEAIVRELVGMLFALSYNRRNFHADFLISP